MQVASWISLSTCSGTDKSVLSSKSFPFNLSKIRFIAIAARKSAIFPDMAGATELSSRSRSRRLLMAGDARPRH